MWKKRWARRCLVGQDGGEGDPSVIIDGDVEELIACASDLACAVAVHTVAAFDDAG